MFLIFLLSLSNLVYVCTAIWEWGWLSEMRRCSWCQTVQCLFCTSSQELYERCDKLRRSAFKMATETEDNDASLGLLACHLSYQKPLPGCFHLAVSNLWPLCLTGDILQASDDLSRVINSYEKIVEGRPINGDSEEPRPTERNNESGQRHF